MLPQTVSIIIPAYNEEKYITECIKSAKNQTVADCEIIVIDNNSTDHTENIARAQGAQIVYETKQGLIPARNRGFEEAHGDIIIKVDADSRLLPDTVSAIQKIFEKDPSIAGVTGNFFVYDAPFLSKSLIPSRIITAILKHHAGSSFLLGPCYALRKSAWRKIQHEVCADDKLVHEDIDLGLHLSRIGKIYFIKTPIIQTSLRRLSSNPGSFLFEYPQRLRKTVRAHA